MVLGKVIRCHRIRDDMSGHIHITSWVLFFGGTGEGGGVEGRKCTRKVLGINQHIFFIGGEDLFFQDEITYGARSTVDGQISEIGGVSCNGDISIDLHISVNCRHGLGSSSGLLLLLWGG